ncbi:MAG: lactate racemase domain-containing protein [Anaerolineae bacterium]
MSIIGERSTNGYLSQGEVIQALHRGLEGEFTNQRVLVLIPDHTRSLPMPILFRALVDVLHDTRQLGFMVALGTHPALSEEGLRRLVGLTREERETRYATVGLFNHAWDDPDALTTIGVIIQDELQQIAGERWHPSLGGDVSVRINKAVLDYDQVIILGPTFPHEVVGFSGGAKYLFPGISGPEMINVTHWLGALAGVLDTIGIRDTPVRAMIHAAAEHLSRPITLISLVVVGEDVAGMFIGDHIRAWEAAVDLSAERHIVWVDEPFQRVLSWAPPMYDELWTAAKAVYKLEPAVVRGGEVILYAPHLDTVSETHGEYIYEVGYHILPHFLQEWERYKHIPLCVLAHSTHVRGSGVMDGGVEKPNMRVTLSSQIPPQDCAQLSLGYLDPDDVNIDEWKDRESEGVLFVPEAGEMLYRVR